MGVTLNVELGDRGYPILIEADLLSQTGLFDGLGLGSEIALVYPDILPERYIHQVTRQLEGKKCTFIPYPDGERNKSFATLDLILTAMLEARLSRKATLIALGGGVCGDMAGFAASIYQRGIPFIQIPTTLLSQVDSSVGGKTAINHPLGKNLIGAFYQPKAVFIDIDVLSTLPRRELSAGLAEVVKYGFIYDAKFIDWLEDHLDSLLALDPDALIYAIHRSCQIKAAIVAQDETEKGLRALLNFGHTFGHAIEAFTEYKSWLHGEAVGTGMVMAATFSQLLGCISKSEVERIKRIVHALGLPVEPPVGMTIDDFMHYMSLDKKVEEGNMRFVTLKALGNAEITSRYPPESLIHTLSEYANS